MVTNVRNAFGHGFADDRKVRPLDADQPKTDVKASEPVERDGAGGSDAYRIPRNQRIGTRINRENWRAWKQASLQGNVSLSALVNAAFEYCFVEGNMDLELARKYDEKIDD